MTVTVLSLRLDPAWRDPLDREALYALLAKVTGRAASWLKAFPETPLTSGQVEEFQSLSVRYLAGEPLAYLLGSQGFWSLELRVTPDVLIPRPDTECLVEAVLAAGKGQAWRIADLGTGSGAIALSLAKECPGWTVIATDASAAALDVARDNARRNGLAAIDFRKGSWFEPLDGRFHALVSNPPYIASDDPHMAALGHEPRSALVAPGAGLADIIHLTTHAARFLHDKGWLFIEHGWEQGEAVRTLFEEAGFKEVRTGYDYGGNPRYTCGHR